MNRFHIILSLVCFSILSLLMPFFFYLGVMCFLSDLALLSIFFVSLPCWLPFALSLYLTKRYKQLRVIEIIDTIRLWAVFAFVVASTILSIVGFLFPTIILVVSFLAGISLLPQLSNIIKEHYFPFKKPWIIAISCVIAAIVVMAVILFLIEQGYIVFTPKNVFLY